MSGRHHADLTPNAGRDWQDAYKRLRQVSEELYLHTLHTAQAFALNLDQRQRSEGTPLTQAARLRQGADIECLAVDLVLHTLRECRDGRVTP